MSRKKAFTLTEILIAVVVMAVLASVAVPGFSAAKKKAAASQAIAYLRTIKTSQKMYFAKWGTYLARANSSDIKAELGAETRAKDYTFSVTTPTPTTFTATATTSGGTLTLNQDGTFTATGTETKYVPAS